MFKYVHPDDLDNLLETLKRAKEKKISRIRINFRLLPNPSTIIYREDIVYYYYNENKEILKTIVIARDISGRRFEPGNLNFEAIISMGLVDNFPGILEVKNFDGEIVFSSKNASEMFGMEPEEIIDMPDGDYKTFQSLIEKYRADDRQVIETGQSIVISKEIGMRQTGGLGYFHKIKIPINVPGQEKRCVLLFAVDITDRLKRENEEVEQKNKLVKQNKILFELSNNSISERNVFSENCKFLTEALTEGLGIEFASIWEVKENEIVCLDKFSKSQNKHTIAEPLALPMWQPYLDILEENHELLFTDLGTNTMPFKALSSHYNECDIKSAMDISFSLGEKFKGIICCENTSIREWGASDLTFARHIGNIKLVLWEQELRKDVERRLLEKTKILRVTAQISQQLHQTTNLEMSLDGILEKMGVASNSSRVYFFTNILEGGYFKLEKEWVNVGRNLK